jgi:hypothetical protein
MDMRFILRSTYPIQIKVINIAKGMPRAVTIAILHPRVIKRVTHTSKKPTIPLLIKTLSLLFT